MADPTPPAFPPPDAYRDLIRLAVAEDLADAGDVTSRLTIPEDAVGVGTVVQKAVGVACGLPLVEPVIKAFDERLKIEPIPGFHLDVLEGRFGDRRTQPLVRVRGPMRSLLAAERTLLNFLGRMSGIATLTRKYAGRVEGTTASVYDTRKTAPGHRALEKYAVACGGGRNHRVGLYDMVLVKDNHLAHTPVADLGRAVADLVRRSRGEDPQRPIEIEVDTVEQFRQVVAVDGVDVILLDNMDCPTMARCVEMRNAAAAGRAVVPELEASGGVTLETVRDIALVGVERIAVGAITHSAANLDVGLDVEPQ